MDLQDLLEMLELDEPEDFEYFENFADLVECDEDITEDALYELFSQVDADTAAEIIGSYFDEIMDNVPDEATDIYMLLENIKRALAGLILAGDEDSIVRFAEELAKFRNWYSFDSEVTCQNVTEDTEEVLSLRDALTLARLDNLDEDEYSFEFDDCLDYELDDYGMSFNELAEAEDFQENIEDDNGILDSGYVYDDELNKF
jgi:hypothetical protein